MSYLPELRASLVKAAQRQAAAAPAEVRAGRERRPRRSRPSAGAIATVLASVATVAVAALAIAVIGHGGHGGGSAATSATSAKTAAARAAATRLLDHVVLPAGAVALPSDPTRQLGSPSDRLGTTYLVDVHRLWRVPGGPASVMRFLRAHRPPGSRPTNGTTSGSGQAPRVGSDKPGTFVVNQATQVFSFSVATGGIIWREVAAEAVAVSGGASVVRVDGEAGFLAARPRGERIPAGVALVTVVTRRTLAGHKPLQRARLITSHVSILALVTLLDALPRAQRPAAIRPCTSRRVVSIRFAFYARGAATPLAVADADLTCGLTRLSVGGHPQPPLTFSLPNGDLKGEISRIRALVSFAPRP